MRELTDRQREMLAFIKQYIAEKGYPPTYREIGKALGVDPGAIYQKIVALEKKGYLRLKPGEPRTLEVIEMSIAKADIPELNVQQGDYLHIKNGRVLDAITRPLEEVQ